MEGTERRIDLRIGERGGLSDEEAHELKVAIVQGVITLSRKMIDAPTVEEREEFAHRGVVLIDAMEALGL